MKQRIPQNKAAFLAERERFMELALAEARLALAQDEVPVGAVLTRDGAVIAQSHNLCQQTGDPTAHAELLCIREGARRLGGRLTGCTLYVTLEPCAMCAGAAVNARLDRLVFGVSDPRAGCCGTVLALTDGCFLHSVEVWGGVQEQACGALLTEFFMGKRKGNA